MRGDPLTTDLRTLSNELFDVRCLAVIFVVGVRVTTVHAHFTKSRTFPNEVVHGPLERLDALVQLPQIVVRVRGRSHALDYHSDRKRGSTRKCHGVEYQLNRPIECAFRISYR